MNDLSIVRPETCGEGYRLTNNPNITKLRDKHNKGKQKYAQREATERWTDLFF